MHKLNMVFLPIDKRLAQNRLHLRTRNPFATSKAFCARPG